MSTTPPNTVDDPRQDPHANVGTTGPGPLPEELTGPESMTNVFAPLSELVGNAVEAPEVTGRGSPAAGDTFEGSVDYADVNRGEPAKVPELVVRHVVENVAKPNVDVRIFRVPVGPTAAAPAAGGVATISAQPSVVLDANELRNRALIRNVSGTAVSIFLVRAGSGGGGAYLNMGYRLQQNGETIEIKSGAPLEAYCALNTDVGTLQIIEEFGTTADGGLEIPT